MTYAEVGGTRYSDLPSGYNHDRRSITLGSDDRAFDFGKEALIGWQAHRAMGARLYPENPPLQEGQLVVVMIRLGLLTALAPCRIVYTTDESDRFGFAYGTLPGHPESGEESFHIVRMAGKVTFEIVAFSRPADPWVRLVGPLARLVQVRATSRYLTGCTAIRGSSSVTDSLRA